MNRRLARAAVSGCSVAVLLGSAVGSVYAGSDPSEPVAESAAMADPGAAGEPDCRDIVAILDAQVELIGVIVSGDTDTLPGIMESLPDLIAAARETAPADVADLVTAWLVPAEAVVAALQDVDLGDLGAVGAALDSISSAPDEQDNQTAIETWAAEHCGWSPDGSDVSFDAEEAADCEILDAAAGAAAAGVDIDVTDLDGTADATLPGFSTKSCSYGNGVMSVSSLSYNSLDDISSFFVDNVVDADGNPGEVLDVDLGDLPSSSLVTRAGPFVLVAVFEAPIPFSVAFSDGTVEPAAAVAAAEAILTAEPAAADTADTAMDEANATTTG
jgi:hypothetical protein